MSGSCACPWSVHVWGVCLMMESVPDDVECAPSGGDRLLGDDGECAPSGGDRLLGDDGECVPPPGGIGCWVMM
jgi:hypothetical protein